MNKRFSIGGVGLCSLLVIFAVLCLTVFAVLTVSTVEAELRLAKNGRDAVLDYYAADVRGEEMLAMIRSGNIPEGVERDGDVYSYTCPISDTAELRIRVRADGDTYTVLQWQWVSVAEFGDGEDLSVWDGEMP